MSPTSRCRHHPHVFCSASRQMLERREEVRDVTLSVCSRIFDSRVYVLHHKLANLLLIQ